MTTTYDDKAERTREFYRKQGEERLLERIRSEVVPFCPCKNCEIVTDLLVALKDKNDRV